MQSNSQRIDALCESTVQQQSRIDDLTAARSLLTQYYESAAPQEMCFVGVRGSGENGAAASGYGRMRLGHILSYDMKRNRFEVLVTSVDEESQEASSMESVTEQLCCKPGELECVEPKRLPDLVVSKLSLALPARPEPSCLQVITKGMELTGSIFIPGLTETSEKTDQYTVTVTGCERDPFGREVIGRLFAIDSDLILVTFCVVAVHAAYQDEQVVHLQIEGTNVCYADRETFCKGNLELSDYMIRLHGSVSQLKEDESGFFYPSKDKTNSFDIKGSRVLVLVQLQAEIERLKEERNDTLIKLSDLLNTRETWEVLRRYFSSGAVHTRYQEVFQQLDWREVKRIGGLRIEKLVNKLRGIVQCLNEKQFDTFEARREYILELKRQGVSRAQIHQQTDKAMAELKKLIHLQLKLNIDNPIDNYTQTKYRNWFLRTNETYERFDTALQKAESRLPLVLIEDWLQSSAGGLIDLTCTICLCDINVTECCKYLRTPCGHNFHPECIKAWLHVNSTCPSCRSQLNE